MIDAFVSLDTFLLIAINHLPHSVLFDDVAMLLSGIGQWGGVWIAVSVLLFYREEIRDHLFFIPFIAVGALSGISEVILKWLVARPRPSADMGVIILTDPGNFSFPSTHATLAFSFAYICAAVDPRIRIPVYTLAVLISLSRVYLGVHYPSDIVAGALLGSAIGVLVRSMELKFVGKSARKSRRRQRKPW